MSTTRVKNSSHGKGNMAIHREKKQSIEIISKEVPMLDLKDENFIAIVNMLIELRKTVSKGLKWSNRVSSRKEYQYREKLLKNRNSGVQKYNWNQKFTTGAQELMWKGRRKNQRSWG